MRVPSSPEFLPTFVVVCVLDSQLASQRINNSLHQWGSYLNRPFSKEEVQMANKHMKKCSMSLAKKEMKMKMTLRLHLTPVKMAIINNTDNDFW
jgi:hypothetical protein